MTARRHLNPRPAIFLDRDGTIIRYVEVPKAPTDITLFKSSGPALRELKERGYLLIVVTNQPIIEKGIITLRTAEQLNDVMQQQLKKFGAEVDAVYVCPHRFGTECRCRKPDIELIERAVKDFNIDLPLSWMVGDSTRDIEAGRRARLPTILVKTGDGGTDTRFFTTTADYEARNLKNAAKIIMEHCPLP